MKQKERMDKKVKQERTEPDHHRKIIIKGMRIMWQARWIPKNINRSGKSIPDSMIACGQHCREQKQKRWK